MATLKEGYLTGKFGNMVGCKWKGSGYLRKAPQRTAPPTPAELVQRHIFGMVRQWIKPINDVVRLGFRGYSERFSGINAAVSCLHKQALYRNGYASSIDPALVQVSFGSLQLPDSLEASLEPNGQLKFSWDPAAGLDKEPRDRILILAYNVEVGRAVYEIGGPQRHEAEAWLNLGQAIAGRYHLYAAFVSDKRQSGSKYLGAVQI